MEAVSQDRAVDRTTARIRQQAETVRREELQTALDRLEATGDLTDDQRAAVEALSVRLVDRLLAVPERRLDAADDAETLETAIALFA